MNILIPIVGSKKKREESQYIRSLYEIQKKTILQYVYESLKQISDAKFIVVIRREDVNRYHLDDMVRLLIPDCSIVISDGETSGSACSCLLAVDLLEWDAPLIIAGGDQLMLENPQKVVSAFAHNHYDGGVVVFDDIHPRWSFVKLDADGMVMEAAEKRPISRNATTGFYYFQKGQYFVEAAEEMIKKDASVHGQYYVCPCFNEMVLANKKIGTYRISKDEYFNFKPQSGIDEYERYLKESKDV